MKEAERRIVEEFGPEHLASAQLAARLYRRTAGHLRRAAALGQITDSTCDNESGEIYAPLGKWREWCRATEPKSSGRIA